MFCALEQIHHLGTLNNLGVIRLGEMRVHNKLYYKFPKGRKHLGEVVVDGEDGIA
jgi:hypothetical protein